MCGLTTCKQPKGVRRGAGFGGPRTALLGVGSGPWRSPASQPPGTLRPCVVILGLLAAILACCPPSSLSLSIEELRRAPLSRPVGSGTK